MSRIVLVEGDISLQAVDAVINAAALHLAAANVASRRLGYRALLPQDVMDAMATVLAAAEPGLVENGND